MKTIIAGSRTILGMDSVVKAISQSGFDISEVVCGEANGIDTLGKVWARRNNIPVKSFWPNWYPNGVYYKLAGYDRNEEMGDYAEALVAIWDGISGGTNHMINYMKKLNKPYYVYNINKPNLSTPSLFCDTWSE